MSHDISDVHGDSGPVPSENSPRRGPINRILSHPIWAGIGGIAAVLAILTPYWFPSPGAGDEPRETAPSASTSPPGNEIVLTTADKDWSQALLFVATDTQVSAEEIKAINSRYRKVLPNLGVIGAADRALSSLNAPRVDYVTGDKCHPTTGITPLKITVQSKQDDVIISDMRARIIDRSDMPRGTVFAITPEGSGDNVTGAFNLNSADLSLVNDEMYGPGKNRYFDTRHITVQRNDPTVFQIHAYESEKLTDWVIDMKIVHDGKTTVVTLDDSGKPFRSTGVGVTPEALYTIRPDGAESGFATAPPAPIDLCS